MLSLISIYAIINMQFYINKIINIIIINYIISFKY